MKSSKKYSQNELKKIWDQVPVDYYEKGERENVGQLLWHSHKRRIFQNIFEKIKRRRKVEKARILDLGCADGHMTNWILSQWPKSEVWGVDVVPKLIKAARKKYPLAHFKLGKGEKLPFEKESFDIVVCSEVLEHVTDPVKVCQEISRVLKKGGTLIIELDTGSWLFSFLWFFWTRFGSGRVWQNAHLHQFDVSTLPQTVARGELHVKKIIKHHLGMAVTVVAEK